MYSLDLSILYFFNHTLASPTLDVGFNILTNVRYWFPVYVIAGVWLIARSPNKRDAIILVLGAVALVAFCDSLAHYFLKPWVGRLRPCAELGGQPIIDWIRLPIGRKLDPSFPSSHAFNNMAVAVYFVTRLGKKAWWLLAVAALIGLGRMYEGVHYPSDVAAGFAFGAFFGWLWAIALAQLSRRPAKPL
jgi:undecaprenyl-diphosphatase